MLKSEVVFALFSIVYGLLLTKVFSSVHVLLRSRARVAWHGLPLVVMWYLTILVLKNWWGMTEFELEVYWGNIYLFIGQSHMLLILYLLVSTALPDEVPEQGLCLRTYYFDNHRYFWGLMILLVVAAFVLTTYRLHLAGTSIRLNDIVVNSVLVAVLLPLALSRRYWVHVVLVALCVCMLLLEVLS